ncbi:MAG: hypothetical protein U9N55_02540, partial [candidate division Zixibacteria bacterium]|nr:hypothetical protein [candidate division Zixibacteria bacterium]
KVVAISTPLTKTKWIMDDIHLSTYGLSLGGSLDLLKYDPDRGYNASAALAIYRTHLDCVTMAYTDIYGDELGNFTFEDKNIQISAGFGFHLKRFCRLGLGLTIKSCKSNLSNEDRYKASATAYDVGIIAELQLHELFLGNLKNNKTDAMFFEFTPSLAFVRANMGGDVSYGDSDNSDPLPTTNHYGASVIGAVGYGTAKVISLRLIFEGEDDKNAEIWTYKRGGELGLADILFLRYGKFSDDPGNVTTYGGGLRLNGVIRWLESIGNLKLRNNSFGRIIRNANLSLNYGRYMDDEGILDGTSFFRIDLST